MVWYSFMRNHCNPVFWPAASQGVVHSPSPDVQLFPLVVECTWLQNAYISSVGLIYSLYAMPNMFL